MSVRADLLYGSRQRRTVYLPPLIRPSGRHPRVVGPPESMSTMSRKKVVRSIGQPEPYILNVADNTPLENRRNLYKDATAVVFCFSIEDESSFENIKNKVN